MKYRYRLTFDDGLVIDVESTTPDRAVSKAKRFYSREDEPTLDVTHIQYSKVAPMRTFAEQEEWEAAMRKKRAENH